MLGVMPDRDALLALVADTNLGVLATIKRSGQPQLSHVNFGYEPDTAQIRISITDGRAKTANLRRDPRASLLVSSSDGWRYAVVEGSVTLSEVAAAPDDEAVEELVDVYRSVRGEDHPDWDDYRSAMVADRRLVCRLAISHVYGKSS